MLAAPANTITLVVALVAAATALASLPVGHWLQGKRERRLWLDDRRLEAYVAFATSTSEVAWTTGTLGALFGSSKAIPHMAIVGDAQGKWEIAHAKFVDAQNRAALLADGAIADAIERISGAVFGLVELMQSTRPISDPDTGTIVHSPNPDAFSNLVAGGDRVAELRDEFIRLARRELGTNPVKKP